MKQRILLIVAVLLIAMPAFATVNITVSAGTGVDANKVTVGYSCTASEKVRAFALNLSLGSAGNSMVFADVNNIHDFITGESNSVSKGYGIFPGQFRNNIDPAGPNWIATYYTPIAPPNDVDSNSTGFGNRTAIAELGTLYVGEANAPGTSGTLFSIRVDANTLTRDTITVTANTIRGGIVLEDGSTVGGNLPQSATISLAPAECFPSTDPQYADWVAVGKPNCWCFTRQCHGNADNKGEGKTNNIWVYTYDLAVFLGAWNDTSIIGETVLAGGVNVPKVCADFDHDAEGKTNNIRVYTKDLAVLLANWNKTTTEPNCPAMFVPTGF